MGAPTENLARDLSISLFETQITIPKGTPFRRDQSRPFKTNSIHITLFDERFGSDLRVDIDPQLLVPETYNVWYEGYNLSGLQLTEFILGNDFIQELAEQLVWSSIREAAAHSRFVGIVPAQKYKHTHGYMRVDFTDDYRIYFMAPVKKG